MSSITFSLIVIKNATLMIVTMKLCYIFTGKERDIPIRKSRKCITLSALNILCLRLFHTSRE